MRNVCLSKLSQPALRFLFFRTPGNFQVLTQFGHRLIELSAPQQNVRKCQPIIRNLLAGLSQRVYCFLRIVLLCGEGIPQQAKRREILRIDLQGPAGCGFRVGISLEQKKGQGKIVVGANPLRVEGNGPLEFTERFLECALHEIAGAKVGVCLCEIWVHLNSLFEVFGRTLEVIREVGLSPTLELLYGLRGDAQVASRNCSDDWPRSLRLRWNFRQETRIRFVKARNI